MGILAAYSIKSAILLSVLFAIYMLTLGKQKSPALRRFTLLGICIASICFPLSFIYGVHPTPVRTALVFSQPTPTVVTSENFTPFIFSAIAGIIVAGICVSALITILSFIRLLTLKTTTSYSNGHRLKLLDKRHSSPFCFCGNIYISKEDIDNLPEMIITHENSHIRHLHFVDILIGRLTLILQWWNPLAWMLTKEIQLVHEYQADLDVLNAGYDSKEYQYLLLSRATGDTKFSLTSGFRHSELKRRLRMINSERPRRRLIMLLLLLIPASLITFALHTSPIVLFINDNFTPVELSSLRNEPRKDTVKTIDEQPHIILDGTQIPYGELNSVNPDAIESITVRKDNPEYPNGVIDIKTKPGHDIFSADDNPKPEDIGEIKVISSKAVRKPKIP